MLLQLGIGLGLLTLGVLLDLVDQIFPLCIVDSSGESYGTLVV
jgi:hypothetical protein